MVGEEEGERGFAECGLFGECIVSGMGFGIIVHLGR